MDQSNRKLPVRRLDGCWHYAILVSHAQPVLNFGP